MKRALLVILVVMGTGCESAREGYVLTPSGWVMADNEPSPEEEDLELAESLRMDACSTSRMEVVAR